MSSKITMKSRQSQEVLPPHSRKGPRLAIVREDSPREALRGACPSAKLRLEEIHALGDAARLISEKTEQRPAQRPPRSFKHQGLHFLIEALYRWIVVEALGELTLWENKRSGAL